VSDESLCEEEANTYMVQDIMSDDSTNKEIFFKLKSSL